MPEPEKPNHPPNAPSLSIDWELYGAMLEASDMSDEDKKEMIEILWNIVVAFVDLGFGLHPVQQACGKATPLDELQIQDVLSLMKDPSDHEQNATVYPQSGSAQEGSPS